MPNDTKPAWKCDAHAYDYQFPSCSHDVRTVRVYEGASDWGKFRYCQNAIDADRRAGLAVEEADRGK